MLKKTFLGLFVFIFFLCFSLGSFSYYDYNQTGNSNGLYELGRGLFNENIASVTTYAKSFTNTKQTPLISDLDNDGIQEIIILADDSIAIMHNKELAINSTYDITSTSAPRFSNMITYDIDGDGRKEIIIVEEQKSVAGYSTVNIIDYTGNVKNQTTFNLPNNLVGEVLIQCKGIDDCLALVVDSFSSQTVNGAMDISAIFFNSSGIGANEIGRASCRERV